MALIVVVVVSVMRLRGVVCVVCVLSDLGSVLGVGLFEDDAGIEVWVQVVEGVGRGSSNDGYWVEMDVM